MTRPWNWKRSVVAVATEPLPSVPPLTVDGVLIEPKACVLATAEPRAVDNGVYRASLDGTMLDRVRGDTVDGDLLMVDSGVCYEGTTWACMTRDPIVVGTTGVVFAMATSAYAEAQPTVTALECPTCGASVRRGQGRCEYCRSWLEFGG